MKKFSYIFLNNYQCHWVIITAYEFICYFSTLLYKFVENGNPIFSVRPITIGVVLPHRSSLSSPVRHRWRPFRKQQPTAIIRWFPFIVTARHASIPFRSERKKKRSKREEEGNTEESFYFGERSHTFLVDAGRPPQRDVKRRRGFLQSIVGDALSCTITEKYIYLRT